MQLSRAFAIAVVVFMVLQLATVFALFVEVQKQAALTREVLGMAAGGEPPGGTGLKPGDSAPDFTLPAPGGKELKLSQAGSRGWALLLSFVRLNCPGCLDDTRKGRAHEH